MQRPLCQRTMAHRGGGASRGGGRSAPATPHVRLRVTSLLWCGGVGWGGVGVALPEPGSIVGQKRLYSEAVPEIYRFHLILTIEIIPWPLGQGALKV